jgi:hypothetical protein
MAAVQDLIQRVVDLAKHNNQWKWKDSRTGVRVTCPDGTGVSLRYSISSNGSHGSGRKYLAELNRHGFAEAERAMRTEKKAAAHGRAVAARAAAEQQARAMAATAAREAEQQARQAAARAAAQPEVQADSVPVPGVQGGPPTTDATPCVTPSCTELDSPGIINAVGTDAEEGRTMTATATKWNTGNPEVREILEAVAEIGWTIATTKNGFRIQSPRGSAALHHTPSDYRWKENTWRDLRRIGYQTDRNAFDQATAGRKEALREATRLEAERLITEAQHKADQRQAEAMALARAAGYLTDMNLLFTPHPGPMRTYTVVITPELAVQLDEMNVDNQRNLTPARVDALAQAIIDGKFKHTHQGIAISTEGRMVDGMHRVKAIIQADKPVVMQVAVGVEPDTFTVIDTGKPRRGSDILRIGGYSQAPSSLAAAARLLYAYNVISAAEKAGVTPPSWTTIRLSNADVMEVVESTNGALPEAVAFNAHMRLSTTAKLVPAAAVTGAYLIHQKWDPQSVPVERFWEGLLDPYSLGSDDPRAALHRNLVNSLERRARRARRDAFTQVPLLIKVFNAVMTGRPLTLASWREVEGMPAVIEPTSGSAGAVAS